MNELEKWFKWSKLYTENRLMGQRLGQACMNALHTVDPEFYNHVTGTECDCFYDENNVVQEHYSNLMTALTQHWMEE